MAQRVRAAAAAILLVGNDGKIPLLRIRCRQPARARRGRTFIGLDLCIEGVVREIEVDPPVAALDLARGGAACAQRAGHQRAAAQQGAKAA